MKFSQHPIRLSSSIILIRSPNLKGRVDSSKNTGCSILIVFLEEKSIILRAATLIAPAATPFKEEK